MEQLASRIARKISFELSYSKEQEDVITYGLIATIQTIVMTSIVIILGLLLNTLYESLVLCFAVSFLRKYSGGTHSSSIATCTIIGVSFCTIFGFVIKSISAYVNYLPYLIVIGGLIYIFAFFIAYKLAPVDSVNKPIRKIEKKIKMKKMTILTLFIYILVSAVFLILSYYSIVFVSLYICLILSVIWQMNSLTRPGIVFLESLDRLIYGIITLKGGHTNEEN